MPFPLAHPAAILPLRRLPPGWLDPAALIVGSIIPDTGYFFSSLGVDVLAHSALGVILYVMPAGVVTLACLRLLAFLAARRWRAGAGWATMLGPVPPLWVTLLSLLVGAGTHLAWDSLTHKTGWLVQAWPALQVPLFPLMGRLVKGHHLLWYSCSFGGLAAVYWAFDRSARRNLGHPPLSRNRLALDTVLVAGLALPIAGIHHLLREPLGNILAASLTLFLLLWIMGRLHRGLPILGGGTSLPVPPNSPPTPSLNG